MYIEYRFLMILVALFLLNLTNIKVIASWNANEIKSCKGQPMWQHLDDISIFQFFLFLRKAEISSCWKIQKTLK